MNGRDLLLRSANDVANSSGLGECRTVREEGTVDWIGDWIDNGERKKKDPLEIAAVALYRTVVGHPFVDCNHRIGSILALSILKKDGYSVDVSMSEFTEFARSIDKIGRGQEEVVEWIRRVARPKREAGEARRIR
jgi:prophage maintenance system killer protein